MGANVNQEGGGGREGEESGSESPDGKKTPPTVAALKIEEGHRGGSVGWAADFGSGRHLTAREFEPRVGLRVGQLRAWSLFRILGLPLSLPLPCSRSVPLKNK